VEQARLDAARHVGAFAGGAEDAGRLFAVHAALALACARMQEQLQEGLRSRDLIGQAKGILVERHSVDAEAAFRALRKTSQDRNVELRDLAARVVRQAETTGRRTPAVEV